MTWRGIQLSLVLITLILQAACSPAQPQDQELVVVGATDVLTIARAVGDGYESASGVKLEARWSKDPFGQLRSGEADAVLVGRELTTAELQGTEASAIAYDAVCILIDRRTYEGGLEQGQVGLLIQPISKFAGLQTLSLSDLRTRYTELLTGQPGEPPWLGMPYYRFQPYAVSPDSLQTKEDPDHPGYALGMWVWNFAPFGGELTPAGLIDTQAALLQRLSLQASLDRPALGFVPPNIGSEEEWISSRYQLDSGADATVSSVPFNFYLMPASRAVTLRALEHGFSVEALLIDGVDPLGDPQDIYAGRYLLARMIYVVLEAPVSEKSEMLVRYLLTPDGQQAIRDARFLPLP